MFGWKLTFGEPVYLLLLLVLIPALWLLSFRSLAGLGRGRRFAALVFRSLVLTAIVAALAEVQPERTSERVTVMFLLDQSESIPQTKRQLMLDYVVQEVAKHRNDERGDQAGVIIFGWDALVEIPPFADDLPAVGELESARELRRDGTNLAAALKLAQASFPEDSAKRIVVVTDGNENIGNARAIAPILAEQGIGVDVVPIQLGERGEVAVEKVVLPSNVRRGQTLRTNIVLHNFGESPVSGKVALSRKLGTQETLLEEFDVTLKPGKNVFTVDEPEVSSAGAFTYDATFTPATAADDRLIENNTASGFTFVRGRGRVLLIEDWEHPGDFDYLVNRLRANELEVEVMGTDQLFTSLAELQSYDAVILANVPRSSGESANAVTSFSDEQIAMLVQNTEHMGCGLVMLGGANSFGAGGWANTELEKAMPVDFTIQNARIQAVGALVMMMHASEMAQGNYWQKVIGIEALKALGPMDYCGVIHWDDRLGREDWLWARPRGLAQVGGGATRRTMLSQLTRMSPGDMPDFDPAMRMALAGLKGVNAAIKHVIIISDGDPSEPTPATIAAYQQANIQISTVAVGTHGPPGSTPLQDIATQTGGKYYVVTNPKSLPRIYQREVRRVSRPLVYEPEGGVSPQVVYDHEVHGLAGEPLPPISGFVLTTVKKNPLVEVTIRSPRPTGEENSTIQAAWTYGLGRTVVFTSDAGARWTNSWTDWEHYDKFFTQMVRWAMRPTDDTDKFAIATDYRDGRVRVVVTALDRDDQFLNLDELTGFVIGPDTELPLKLQQVAPGRYVGEFAADQAGNFFLTVQTGTEELEVDGRRQQRARPPLITGISVPYSSEYRDRETNLALLKMLAETKPRGGDRGQVLGEDLNRESLEELTSADTFRQSLEKAVSSQDIWPLILLIAACVFFADVFIRRVTVDFTWVPVTWRALTKRLGWDEDEVPAEEHLERLRDRKAAVAGQIDERRSAVQFEPETPPSEGDVDKLLRPEETRSTSPRSAAKPEIAPGAEPEKEEESYTARLLKAKRQARRPPGSME